MAHFAEIRSDNNTALRVIVIGEQQLGTYPETYWKRTSYNTIRNTHRNGETPFRGNYAGIDSIYDVTNDIFYGPQPYSSWSLNLSIADWEAPVAFPSSTTYGDNVQYQIQWDEDNLRWIGIADDPRGSNKFEWIPDISSWISTAE